MSRRDVSGLDPRQRQPGVGEGQSRSDRLPPPRPRTQPQRSQSPQATAPQPPAESTAEAADSSESARRRISVTLPVEVRRRLAAAANREDVTHSQLALEAVDQHPRPAQQDPSATSPGDRLAPPREPATREGMVATTLYIDTARLARLDALATEAGISRSELVREALRRHLPE